MNLRNGCGSLGAGLLIVAMLAGCERKKTVPVALMTKLEAGSIVGSTEVNAGRMFLEEHPGSLIEVVAFDDAWDPVKARAAYQEVKARGIGILVTSHVSGCAIAISDDVNRDKTLTFVTGAVTNKLSGRDDYILRVVQDVDSEQTSIAAYVNGMPQRKLLVVRDTDNEAYTRPALEIFEKALAKGKPRTVEISISRLDLAVLEQQMRSVPFDLVYVLIGGYRATAGSIAQLALKVQPEAKLVFTPWMKTPALLETAGTAIARSVVPSHYPPRGTNGQVDRYVERYKKRFGKPPTFISLNVYAALGIIHEGIGKGHRSPESLRAYVLQKRVFETEFGKISFDATGDAQGSLYFITDLPKEF